MNHLFYKEKEYLFTRGEMLCWSVGSPVFGATISGEKILNQIDTILKNNPSAHLVIDCWRLTGIQNNFLEELFQLEALDNERDIIFIRNKLGDDILEQLLKVSGFTTNRNENKTIIVANKSDVKHKKNQLNEIQSNFLKYFENNAKDFILKTFLPNDLLDTSKFELLQSTPLLSNGEFDASKILSDPLKFSIVISYAADILEKYLTEKGLTNKSLIKFLAVNLRSAPIASALSNILGYELFTIDHLGPNHKLFNLDFSRKAFGNNTYIYIGDFLVGGSEVKIAQNYIQFLGGRLENVFVLGTYFNEHDNRFLDKFDFSYLVCIKEAQGFKLKFD